MNTEGRGVDHSQKFCRKARVHTDGMFNPVESYLRIFNKALQGKNMFGKLGNLLKLFTNTPGKIGKMPDHQVVPGNTDPGHGCAVETLN